MAKSGNELINELTGYDRDESLAARKCPFCKRAVDHVPFVDEASVREARISGLCQPCQDEMFGDED